MTEPDAKAGLFTVSLQGEKGRWSSQQKTVAETLLIYRPGACASARVELKGVLYFDTIATEWRVVL